MDKQLRNRGFSIVEMLIVLSILALLTLITMPLINRKLKKNVLFVINDIAFKQFEAINENTKTIYDEYDTYITFNRKGGINHADTYYIEGVDVIVSLGTGRIYIHDEEKGQYPD